MKRRRRLEYDDAVIEEILAAKRWWLNNREKAPRAFDLELDAAIKRITRRPEAGIPVTNTQGDNLRRVLLRRAAKHLYYLIEDDWIVILALHPARGERPDLAERGPRRRQ